MNVPYVHAWLSLIPEVPTVSVMSLRSIRPVRGRLLSLATLLLLVASLLPAAAATPLGGAPRRWPRIRRTPTSVTIAGSLDRSSAAPGTGIRTVPPRISTYDARTTSGRARRPSPRAAYEYKAALNDAGTENYGLNAAPGGDNIPLNLGAATAVKFYYSHGTHWVTDNVSSTIVTVPGSFQSRARLRRRLGAGLPPLVAPGR